MKGSGVSEKWPSETPSDEGKIVNLDHFSARLGPFVWSATQGTRGQIGWQVSAKNIHRVTAPTAPLALKTRSQMALYCRWTTNEKKMLSCVYLVCALLTTVSAGYMLKVKRVIVTSETKKGIVSFRKSFELISLIAAPDKHELMPLPIFELGGSSPTYGAEWQPALKEATCGRDEDNAAIAHTHHSSPKECLSLSPTWKVARALSTAKNKLVLIKYIFYKDKLQTFLMGHAGDK